MISFHTGNSVMNGPSVAEQRNFFEPELPLFTHNNGVIPESDHFATRVKAAADFILQLPERAADYALIHFHTFSVGIGRVQ